MFKLIILVAVFSTASISSAEDVDYNTGFCVPFGQEFLKENSVVDINNTSMNDLFIQSNHQFFNFEKGNESLSSLIGFNWSRNNKISKLADPFHNRENLAVYSDFHHPDVVSDPIMVECISENDFEMQN